MAIKIRNRNNEVVQLAPNLYRGTNNPASNIGENGDLYFKLTNNSDEIKTIYLKENNTWILKPENILEWEEIPDE